MSLDIREIYKGEKIEVKLTKKNISQLKNGKILEGFKVSIGLEVEE